MFRLGLSRSHRILAQRTWHHHNSLRVFSSHPSYKVHAEILRSPSNEQAVVNGDISVQWEKPRTSILMELDDRVGILSDVLRYFWKFDVNICRIESRPNWGKHHETSFDFFVDLEGSVEDANVKQLLQALEPITGKLLTLDEKQVHWFPRHVSELDRVANRILSAGTDLESDHPGFHDAVSNGGGQLRKNICLTLLLLLDPCFSGIPTTACGLGTKCTEPPVSPLSQSTTILPCTHIQF